MSASRLRGLPGRLWFAFLLCAALPAVAELRVEGAWVREPPPVPGPLAAYLDLVNDGTRARTLVGVRSPDAGSVMLHATVHADGVARMRHLDELVVPPGERVLLAPGGAHLMLFAPARPVTAGDQLRLILEFADGDCLQVDAPVVPSRSR